MNIPGNNKNRQFRNLTVMDFSAGEPPERHPLLYLFSDLPLYHEDELFAWLVLQTNF